MELTKDDYMATALVNDIMDVEDLDVDTYKYYNNDFEEVIRWKFQDIVRKDINKKMILDVGGDRSEEAIKKLNEYAGPHRISAGHAGYWVISVGGMVHEYKDGMCVFPNYKVSYKRRHANGIRAFNNLEGVTAHKEKMHLKATMAKRTLEYKREMLQKKKELLEFNTKLKEQKRNEKEKLVKDSMEAAEVKKLIKEAEGEEKVAKKQKLAAYGVGQGRPKGIKKIFNSGEEYRQYKMKQPLEQGDKDTFDNSKDSHKYMSNEQLNAASAELDAMVSSDLRDMELDK
jgi:hypothetical protein